MERELFLTGYCRCLDQSRLVTAVLENGTLTEVDCSYPGCLHAPNCDIAARLREEGLKPECRQTH